MSRSGYVDDGDHWALIRWRGAVKSATKGKRGQAFFNDLLAALDAMPDKRLIRDDLESGGEFCALGVLGHARGVKMDDVDAHEPEEVASLFDIASALAKEVAFMNDEFSWTQETPEQRWQRMRGWVADQIKDTPE